MRLLQGSIAMAAILAGMAGTALAQGDVYIPVTSTPPVIDGILANDPGWEGSSRIDLDCSGVAPVNYVRLCRTADASPKIYVGFRMESTSVPPGSFDRIILALQPMTPDDGTAAAHAWRIHIDPFSQRSDAGTYSPGGVQFWMNSAGWKNATGTDPDLMLTSHWLQKANMKVTCEANGKWGFEMALTVNPDPATAQQNIGVYVPSQGRFKLYLDVIKIEGTSLANQHAWPKNVFVSPTLTGGTPLPDTWGNASYTASASTSVQLTYDKIGTTIPPSLKNYSIAPYTPVSDPDCPSIVDAEHSGQFGPSNTIYCKPRNRMPMTAELRTTFSIADWGVPAPSDWFTVTYPPTVAPPMPQLVNPTDWATVAPGIMKTMTLQWPMSYKQSCQMGSVLDKSIKVDLEGKGDTKFTETPVIRSVASGLSSEFRHDARIGTAGYPATPDGIEHLILDVTRDVHPRFVPRAGSTQAPPRRGIAAAAVAPAAAAAPSDADLYVSAEAFAAAQFAPEVQEALTWTCRAYRRTGKTLSIDDRPQKLTVEELQAVGGFEYVVGHAGEVESWASEFSGQGLRRRSDGLYDLDIPAGKVGLVHTRIEAEEFRRWAAGFRVGFSVPHGKFADAVDGGLTETATLEYRFSPHLSAEGRFGYAHFDGTSGFTDTGITNTSIEAKVSFLSGDWQPFVNAGVGYYLITPGQGHGGANVGVGVRWRLSDHLGLVASYDYHDVFVQGSDAQYSEIQGGADLRF